MAPEVLMEKPYGKECDYWGIGVVTFLMLSGTPPFYAPGIMALYEKIKACKYDFDAETWKNVTPEAKDFINKLLLLDPKLRLNCDEMLTHKWMNVELQENIR